MQYQTAAALLALLSIAAAATLYYFSASEGRLAPREHAGPPSMLRVEATGALPSGGIEVFVRNVGSSATRLDYVILEGAGGGVLAYPVNTTLPPGGLERVIVPRLFIEAAGLAPPVKVKAAGSAEAAAVFRPGAAAESPGASAGNRNTMIALVAYRSRNSPSERHWVVFDYLTGRYMLYEGSGSYPGEPYTGRAPILQGVDEYTISTRWVPWGERPLDSPILIVVNPTRAGRPWIFTWHDPHGTYRFLLQPLKGDVEIDFLVFWEDLFNPFKPPWRVDDWKDHVVRVTVFTNGTYRIAVYMAKGGYSHEFVLKPASYDPLNGTRVYTKPFGKSWARTSSYNGETVYVEMCKCKVG